MFKKSIVLGLILCLAVFVLKMIVVGFSKVQLAGFQPAAVIFLLDISASNRELMGKQAQTILKISNRLDGEDKTMIYLVSEDAYNVYEGNPHRTPEIKKAIEKRGEFDSKAYGTAYGVAFKKAVGDALHYKANGFSPTIIVLGDLENEGSIEKQINWKVFPKNMKNTVRLIPDLKLAFLYAHPQKLDEIRQLLLPVFDKNPNNLIFASEEGIDQATRKLMDTIGR